MPTTKPVPTGVMAKEPASIAGTITALVAATITLLVAFGLDLTEQQSVAVMGVAFVVAPIIQAIVTRQSVFSPASAQVVANRAAHSGDATIPDPPGRE